MRSTFHTSAPTPPKPKYPCLMRSVGKEKFGGAADRDLIVLFTADGTGIALSKTSSIEIGYAPDNGWVMYTFEPFEGSVTLQS